MKKNDKKLGPFRVLLRARDLLYRMDFGILVKQTTTVVFFKMPWFKDLTGF